MQRCDSPFAELDLVALVQPANIGRPDETTRIRCARPNFRNFRLGDIKANDNVITLWYIGWELREFRMQTTDGAKRETLNIRIKADIRDLIDRAAKSRGKNRTDFILDSARAAAEDALLDQVMMAATPQAYAQFLARLDLPPKANVRLRKTMATSAPWNV